MAFGKVAILNLDPYIYLKYQPAQCPKAYTGRIKSEQSLSAALQYLPDLE